MIATPRSCIYRGQLRHRRFVPCGHAFSYQLWMAWLDLDELPRLFTQVPGFSAQRSALARYRREDYLAPHDRPLKQAVRERLASELGGDLAAALLARPSVATLGDRGGQLSVRGGTPTQNLFLVDGIPVFQPFHLLGGYSALPAGVVRSADVYAGGWPARFGGRIASVVDVVGRTGS